jgi:hypothetical protein
VTLRARRGARRAALRAWRGTRLATLLALVASCGSDRPGRAACPSAFAADERREAAVREVLASDPAGRALLASDEPVRICFGNLSPSVRVVTGQLLVDDRLSVNDAAARVGHLLVHGVDGSTRAGVSEHERLEAEVSAHMLELELRARFGAYGATPVLWFADAYWAAPPAGREGVVRAALGAPDRPDARASAAAPQ